MRILLFSTYEMGHQPLSLAWPLAALHAAGIHAEAYDLSVEPFPEVVVRSADVIAISVPMHTALRLGVETARQARQLQPDAHIIFFGLYAALNSEYLCNNGIADSILAGEIEPALVEVLQQLDAGLKPPSGTMLKRTKYPVPLRMGLPELSKYAHLERNGTAYLAGYTEASRGCLHSCSHCPIVPVYQGRFFAVPVETVMADVRHQIQAGAAHITFGDPDFLNGPTHALRIARRIHAEFPDLTFDFTAKVEHLIKHQDLLPDLVRFGALFVVCAFESTSDLVLQKLDKGHTVSDMEMALEICRSVGLFVQPTWVAFTPWTTYEDYLEMLHWTREKGIVSSVPAIQYAIRLLIPPNSLILEREPGLVDSLDAENFSYRWQHPDPAMELLHSKISAVVEGISGASNVDAFRAVEEAAYRVLGQQPPAPTRSEIIDVAVPRLTEDWFC